jgi:hypothetical protein
MYDAGDDYLTVELDGSTYEVEENVDLDGDGDYDAAVVRTDSGYVTFADTDEDGVADVAAQLDPSGNVVAIAEYDEDTGQWTDSAGGGYGGSMYHNDATDVTVSQSGDGSGGYLSTGDGTTVLTDGSGGVYVSTDDHSWST